MILHTLNISPESAVFADCLNSAEQGDAILLLGLGVYAALSSSPTTEQLRENGADIYALSPDVEAVGVAAVDPSITVIDMLGFVALTERFEQQMAWY